MSNDLERIAAWWTELDDDQRRLAVGVGDELPNWMAISLSNNGVEVTAPDPVHGQPLGFTTPRAFREFLADQLSR